MKASAAIVRNVGGPFVIEDIEVAEPRGAEVRVRMVGVGMCHTDLVARDGFPVPLPIVLGHEGSGRSEEHTSELQSLMRISYAVFCLKKKTKNLHTILQYHSQQRTHPK